MFHSNTISLSPQNSWFLTNHTASISTGKEWEAETGTYYFGARRYDPTIGMWLGMDPVRQFWSPYTMTGNELNPLIAYDINGKEEKPSDYEGDLKPGDWIRGDKESFDLAMEYWKNYAEEKHGTKIDQIKLVIKHFKGMDKKEEISTFWDGNGVQGDYYEGYTKENGGKTMGIEFAEIIIGADAEVVLHLHPGSTNGYGSPLQFTFRVSMFSQGDQYYIGLGQEWIGIDMEQAGEIHFSAPGMKSLNGDIYSIPILTKPVVRGTTDLQPIKLSPP